MIFNNEKEIFDLRNIKTYEQLYALFKQTNFYKSSSFGVINKIKISELEKEDDIFYQDVFINECEYIGSLMTNDFENCGEDALFIETIINLFAERKLILKDKDSKGRIFVIAGPSGVGKTTIETNLANEFNFKKSISFTTRERRNGEFDGKDYFFISTSDFKNKVANDEFIEWTNIHGNCYGTESKFIEDNISSGQNVIVVLDNEGTESLIHKFKNLVTSFFIIPPSLDSLKKRILKRNDNVNDMDLRLQNAFNEILNCHKYDHVIKNDTMINTMDEISQIVENKLKRIN